MDPILDARLKAIENKLDETHRMVSNMRRAQKTAAVMRWLYWAIIIGIGIASLYLIQPYLEQLRGAYSLIGGGSGTETGAMDYSALLEQFNDYQSGQ